jgi:outer membrane protein assembly factor BamB
LSSTPDDSQHALVRLTRLGLRAALLLPLACLSAAEEWNRFRGPNGSGVSNESGFPVEFGKQKNLVWRVRARPGKSSPILTADRVFLTAFEDGALFTQCFDRKTGKLFWERSEPRPRDEAVNKLNHPAALTPVTDGQNVYSFFKDFGLISYDRAGKLRWKAPLGPYSVSMGLGSSPILAGASVIVLADLLEGSFIAAYDRSTGEMRWRTARQEGEGWATPLLWREQVLTISRGQFGAHDAPSGKRTANLDGISPAIIASPVLDHDTLFLFGYGNIEPPPFSTRLQKADRNGDGKLSPDEYGDDAFMRSVARYGGNRDLIVSADEWDERQRGILGHNGVMAIRVGPQAAPRELWRTSKTLNGVIPSPLLYGGVLYVVRNGGILLTLDAGTGRILKEARVPGAIGGYSSSPVAADGKVYLVNEDGKAAVLRAGPDWEVLAVNDLDEPCYATPALSHGEIYFRTGKALYCFAPR